MPSPYFKEAVPQYLVILEEAVVAPWAGKRIICIGDYADDLPEDFLTDREKAMIPNNLLYRYADRFTRPSPTSETNVGYCLRAYMYLMGSNLSTGMKKELKSMCFTPLIDPVLRNLTTKEYVRSTAVPSDINFGHILLLKICWTSDPSMSLGYRGDEDFHRGAWAGHRFDIASPEWVDSTWKDVSDAVVPKVAAIFRAG
ncbi:hypothetical protein DL89DRAFT_305715 [Linderina pennispora]|uniref:Uncharacterized protein n=1 Tax=Linderina pennispora TaxID=61395 RepID=A0A1Y1W084_9FUNG|nr:uncharacterized protein DL89DRAFT_305715 [Linderina pennispora]ORX66913.1 hypothetical protein DL89DRAFT_305715 [Linderina pennispora]